MENEFQRIVIDSSMGKPSYLSGHTQEIQRPCRVFGLYNEKTGTIIVEHVWCDGVTYPTASFALEELNKFYLELTQYLIDAF